MNLSDQIIADLKAQFRFKSDKGRWLQQGKCPQCDRWEAFCAAEDPKVVKCGRATCGWEDSVRNLLPDLFEDWTRRAPPTETNPNATADAYLSVERGLDLQQLAGLDKAEWSDDTRAAALKLEAWPLETMSGAIVHVIRKEAEYLDYFFRRCAHHESGMRERVRGLHNARCIKTHSQLAAAVDCLKGLFPVQDSWLARTVEFIDRMALDRQESCGGDHVLVADFWEKVDFLLSRESADAHANGESINQHRHADQYMAINLSHFEQRCRNAGLQPVNMIELKRMLKGSKSRKFIGQKQVNNPKGHNSHCWVFEQPGQPAASTRSPQKEMA